jgi:uncharacterized membrane protein
MTILIIGLAVFFAIHLVPAMSGLKQALKGQLGDKGYQGMFTLLAFAGLGLIIWGYSRAEWVDVYFPPDWGRHVTMVLVFVAFILLAAANMRGRIRKTLKHPMLIGILLWGTGHLLANGDLASVLLFGSFVAYAVIDIALASAQGRVAQFEVKPAHDIMAVVGGAVVYAVFIFLHPYVIGVPIIQ